MEDRWFTAQELRAENGVAKESLHPLGDGIRWSWPCGCVAVTFAPYAYGDRVWMREVRCTAGRQC